MREKTKGRKGEKLKKKGEKKKKQQGSIQAIFDRDKGGGVGLMKTVRGGGKHAE